MHVMIVQKLWLKPVNRNLNRLSWDLRAAWERCVKLPSTPIYECEAWENPPCLLRLKTLRDRKRGQQVLPVTDSLAYVIASKLCFQASLTRLLAMPSRWRNNAKYVRYVFNRCVRFPAVWSSTAVVSNTQALFTSVSSLHQTQLTTLSVLRLQQQHKKSRFRPRCPPAGELFWLNH